MQPSLLVTLVTWGGLLLPPTTPHVSLTFPPARPLPLDFLNNFWTPAPCGMPRTNAPTPLRSASSFNVTWHLGYAHQGAYRLQLLDADDNHLADLTPSSHFPLTTAQSHSVSLPPNVTSCRRCTLRLLRDVPEFAPNFHFVSCADVDILPAHSYTETCSGRGVALSKGGPCTCYARAWGDRCQYVDECDTDLDCNGVGRCLFLGGSALPRKQCFCPSTHFGVTCNRRNPQDLAASGSTSTLDLKRHVRIPLDPRVILYVKFLVESNEMEFAMRINGTSYAGLGWRPAGLTRKCKEWPFNPRALELTAQDDERSHRSFTKRDTTFTITRAEDVSPGAQRQSQSQQQTSPDVQQQGRTAVTSVQRQVDQTTSTQQSSPVNSNRREQSYSSPGAEWGAKDPFTPMDCSDIILGSARGPYARIRDSYARGRHTPLPDSFWGGRDDLSGAVGWEDSSAGVTTLVFRRRIEATGDGPDHPLTGDSQVIWARGQEPGETVVDPDARLDPSSPTVSHFYTRDEAKYHGLGGQRGSLFIDFSSLRKEFLLGGKYANL